MNIELGTENTPYLRGKTMGTCRIEAAYNYLTEKVIIKIMSMVDNRVKQAEFDHAEANATWANLTGDNEPLLTFC
ncbi:hypothetical protein [Lonepinella sp. BR2474]|uniref:hypothetical protein n=1 Tax=Lonepinella sp. BR2474 TaxID=3434548 RepID=UPI003F6E2438